MVTSLKRLNQKIDKIYPGVFLVKGDGYFYVASDDEKMALKIAGLYQSGIYVCHLTHQSEERWIEDVKRLMEQKND